MNGFVQLLTRIIDWFYIKPFRKIMPIQTFRYGAVGALNVAFSWVLFYLIFHYVVREQNVDLGFFVLSGHVATQIIVFIIITATGFLLNRYVAFKNSPLRGRTQLMRYILSVCGAWAINVLFLKLFTDVLHIFPTPSFILATIIVTVYSYLMQKYFTFKGAEKK